MLAPIAHRKGLKVACEIEPDLPLQVVGDAVRLKQMVANLLANAIKFTEEGEVMARAGVVKRQDAGSGAGGPGPVRIWYEVRDTGVGISRERLGRIFDPFSHADSATIRRHGGTGLGLAIVKQLAELMRGQVSVQSEVGEGTVFRLEVELLEAPWTDAVEAFTPTPCLTPVGKAGDIPVPLPPWREGPPESVDHGSLRRILLVEDNRLNQAVVLGMLDDDDLQVVVARDGLEALETMLRGRSFDLVLMDLQMPRMDGLEATRAIRSEPELVQPPIVAITASATARDRDRCLEAGMDGIMTKPFTREALLEMVDSFIRRPEQGAPPEQEESGHEAAGEATDAFDRQEALKRVGDEALLREIVVLILQDVPRQVAALEQAMSGGASAGDVERLAHQLAGACGNVSAHEMERLARAILADARQGNIEADRRAELGPTWARLREELLAFGD